MTQPPKMDCPKCGSNATWYTTEDRYVVLNCHCGVNKYVLHVDPYGQVSKVSTVGVPDRRPPELPEKASKGRRCLLALAKNYPHPMKVHAIATEAKLKKNEAGAFLGSMEHKGMVRCLKRVKRNKGGSTWALTDKIVDTLELKDRLARRRAYQRILKTVDKR